MIEQLSKYNIIPRGIIHVGAHEGQEYEEYLAAGIEKMMFFEPLELNFMKLIGHVQVTDNIQVFNMALGNESGHKEMYVESSNQGMSSSILEPKETLKQYPWIVFDKKETVKIDLLDNISYKRRDFNVLNIDVQGFELEVLQGAEFTLNWIDAIITEVNRVEMYKGCALISDIDFYLDKFCFTRVSPDVTENWGEALYIRNKFL